MPQLGSEYIPTNAGGQSFNDTTGNGNNFPSILGTGMYTAYPITSDPSAFNNPIAGQALNQLGNEYNNYLGSTTKPVVAGQAAGGNQGVYNQGIAGQTALANQYQQMAAGNGPSLAAVTAGQQGAANLAANESMLGSARGAGNPAAAQLAARNAQATGAQQVAQNAVQGRTQEELGALGAASSLYGNIGGQGLQEQGMQQSLNQFNTGQANQIGMSNQANNLAANTNYMNSLSTQNLAQQQGQIAGQTLNANTQLGEEGIQATSYNNAAKANSGLFGGLMSTVAGAAGAAAFL